MTQKPPWQRGHVHPKGGRHPPGAALGFIRICGVLIIGDLPESVQKNPWGTGSTGSRKAAAPQATSAAGPTAVTGRDEGG